MKTTALILAAGFGKRMESEKAKVLHEVGGIPLLLHVYHSVLPIINVKPIVVVSPNYMEIKCVMGDMVDYAIQNEPLGTGHAAMAAVDFLRRSVDQVILMYGDMPFIRTKTLEKLVNVRESTQATIAMMSMYGDRSSTFGRVVRNDEGIVTEVIEWADAKQRINADELLSIRELNAGLYCFESEWFCENVSQIIPQPSRDFNEFYLTDIYRIAFNQRRLVVAIPVDNNDEFFGISTKNDLTKAELIYNQQTHLRN